MLKCIIYKSCSLIFDKELYFYWKQICEACVYLFKAPAPRRSRDDD